MLHVRVSRLKLVHTLIKMLLQGGFQASEHAAEHTATAPPTRCRRGHSSGWRTSHRCTGHGKRVSDLLGTCAQQAGTCRRGEVIGKVPGPSLCVVRMFTCPRCSEKIRAKP